MSEQKLKIARSDGKLSVGGVLNSEQVEALGSVTPSADDILSNMDLYNEEISELEQENMEEAREAPVAKTPKTSGKRRLSKKINKKQKLKEATMNFDEELENLDTKLSEQEEAPVEQENVGSDMRSQILELLKKSSDAPTEQDIAKWKAQYGNNGVHVMALGEGDVYIFTHLKRGQWKKIQEMMAKIQESGNSDVEDDLKEKVIQHCCLWPQLGVEFFYNSRAGVADSLYQVILLNSYFLSPQQAMLLTTQL